MKTMIINNSQSKRLEAIELRRLEAEELINNGMIPSKEKVFDTLCKLSGWTYYYSGLGMEKTIDAILEPKKSNLTDEDIQDNIDGAEILLENGKITKENYNNFVKELKSKKLVYDTNGNWMPVNKLNTNFFDLAELLTDFLFESFKQGGLASRRILVTINNTDNLNEIKKVLTSYKNGEEGLLSKLIQKYSKSPEDLYKYGNDSVPCSKKGERL